MEGLSLPPAVCDSAIHAWLPGVRMDLLLWLTSAPTGRHLAAALPLGSLAPAALHLGRAAAAAEALLLRRAMATTAAAVAPRPEHVASALFYEGATVASVALLCEATAAAVARLLTGCG